MLAQKNSRLSRRSLVALLSAVAVATPAAAVTGVVGTAAAHGAEANDVVINEVESNGDEVADWVELANTNDTESVDVSGWKILDNKDKHEPVVLPAGTEIESGGYLAIYTEEGKVPEGNIEGAGFGLGSDDSVRLFDADGQLVEQTSWTGHAATTWGRVPDKTGEFGETGEPTRGLANVGPEDKEDIADEAWPFDPQDITAQEVTGAGADAFAGEDMSGIDVDADGTVWIVNNDKGTLFALQHGGADEWKVAGHWQLRYPDGAGEPDAEGVAVGADGALYVSTERNNEEKKDSRPSVLRFDKPVLDGADTELTATDEWSFAKELGEIGANAGLEAIEYLPDAWGGVYAVGVEATGEVIFAQLGDDGQVDIKQRYDSPFEGVMALDYDEKAGELRALCDDECDGASILLGFDEKAGQFAPVSGVQARPKEMGNFNNEGFATFPADKGRGFLWADDGVNDGVSLRGAVAAEAGVDEDADAGDKPDHAGQGADGEGTNSEGNADQGGAPQEGNPYGSALLGGLSSQLIAESARLV